MMSKSKHLLTLLLLIGLLSIPMLIRAQTDSLAVLTLGQPVSGEITDDSPAVSYSYTLSTPSLVTFQVISETAQPTITVLRDSETAAHEPNEAGAFITSLSTVLSEGDYEVQIGSVNDTVGNFVLVVQTEQPIQITPLVFAVPTTDEVSVQKPIVFYQFPASIDPTILSVVSNLPTSGVRVTLWNETLNRESGTLSEDLLGGTFHIPGNSANYRLEIAYSEQAPSESFTLCWYAASARSCEATAPQITPQPATPSAACTVTPANSNVNIRSSASTSAPILGSLDSGQTAEVIGLSPDGFFHNIQLGGLIGWVATSVVVAGGECSNVPVVNPPDFVPVPTQAPTQTVVATQTPTSAATMITMTPTTAASPTSSGPCLLTLNSPVKVYSEPIEKVDFLYDQVQSGELIPTGRLADNSWWQTNYGGTWVSTSLIGGALTLTGSCSLPVVTP